ncbi:MAG: undecaprenyl/decaprenyl-phosphate alpha-N-acetylglucosaminyl 1-phosphate transferase [Flavobacteriales bacterium]|nr:undecaprenyl/decaprenyl-phosphate alpha-N-acetylglucosaminyl 1-phosphate transferase [Flavobacteriales bacterium]
MYSFDYTPQWIPWWLFPSAVVFFFWLGWTLRRWMPWFGTGRKSLDTASRWSANQKPTLGGLIFAGGLLAALATQLLVPGFHFTQVSVGYYAGAFLAFAIGLWDDINRMSPLRKFIWQWIAAGIFIAGLWGTYPVWLMLMLWAWIVVLMNSMNMFDNMDGIATSVGMAAMAPLLFMNQGLPVTLFMTAALFAFLWFNWPKSKMFMGDSGSHLLGYVLALLPFLKDLQISSGEPSVWMPARLLDQQQPFMANPVLDIILLATILCIPLSDTAIVTINRISAGRSPARGGRDHTSHNLSYAGLSGWQICVLIMLVGLLGYWLNLRAGHLFRDAVQLQIAQSGTFNSWRFVDTLGICLPNLLLIACTFITLFSLTRINLKKGKFSYSS